MVWLVTLLVSGCGTQPEGPEPTAPEAPFEAEVDVDVEIPTAEYPIDMTVGDKSVPAELGGPGFVPPEGWTTQTTVHVLGNPDAPQGGEIVEALNDWPVTLRFAGKDYNTSTNYFWRELMLMTLLRPDPVTYEPVPSLATHWYRNEDDTVFRFRINPAAMWSDGKPVVAEDFVATYDLLTDETLLDPLSIVTWGRFERPVALSKYMLEVKVKEPRWQNFLLIAQSFWPFPAHEIKGLTGAEYLDKYQNKYTAVNGPYAVNPDDIVLNQTHITTRRTDWWAEDNPTFDGKYNIGRIRRVVIKDTQLTFEKIKKGEIDFYLVPKAQWWAEDIPAHPWVKRGLLYPAKFYTSAPKGTSGLALNMRRPPLDDVNVRKALQLLTDRQTMIEKLYYNEYDPFTSYWQFGAYANPENELFGYDEFGAVELLEKSGWTEIDGDGYRVKDGKVLGFEIIYRSPLTERSLTQFQEACKRAGIKIDLKLLTTPALWKTLREKQYDIASMQWGATLIPNPEQVWHSKFAEKVDNNNVTSLADARVDELIAAYDAERDQKKREAIMRDLDARVYELHPYVLWWYNASQRVLVTNKFGYPEPWGSSRFAEVQGETHLAIHWWIDPDKEKAYEAAKADESVTLETPPTHWRFWQAWSKAQIEKEMAATDSPAPAQPAAPAEAAGDE